VLAICNREMRSIPSLLFIDNLHHAEKYYVCTGNSVIQGSAVADRQRDSLCYLNSRQLLRNCTRNYT